MEGKIYVEKQEPPRHINWLKLIVIVLIVLLLAAAALYVWAKYIRVQPETPPPTVIHLPSPEITPPATTTDTSTAPAASDTSNPATDNLFYQFYKDNVVTSTPLIGTTTMATGTTSTTPASAPSGTSQSSFFEGFPQPSFVASIVSVFLGALK